MTELVFHVIFDEKHRQNDTDKRKNKVKIVVFDLWKSCAKRGSRKVQQVFNRNSCRSPKYACKKTQYQHYSLDTDTFF